MPFETEPRDVRMGRGDRGDADGRLGWRGRTVDQVTIRTGMLSTGPADAGALRARRRHYAAFCGEAEVDAGRPLALVHGNCQAESLRILLDDPTLATVRVPPVHELCAGDLPHLRRLLARTAVLVAQPVRDGYRGLPVGTAELRAQLGARARVVVVPVIRFAGLYPTQAIVRPPDDPSAVPPLVPYHDLRVLARAAGLQEPRGGWLDRATVRTLADRSRAELARRERAHGTLVVSDLFARPEFAQMRTLNHPGNPVWLAVARRVRAQLGVDGPVTDPGRPLLDSVHGPREPAVIEAFGLADDPRPDWTVDGATVSPEEMRNAHLGWYARHPGVVAAGLARHGETLRILARA